MESLIPPAVAMTSSAKIQHSSGSPKLHHVHQLSLLNGFTSVSVFFSVFIFLKRFPVQLFLVPYSYLLLSTPLLVCFLVNQPHYHRFSFFINF